MTERLSPMGGGPRATIETLKDMVRGDPDLELIARRMEQMELLLEGIAELKAAKDEVHQAAAESKVATMRQGLRDPLPGS